MGSIDGEPAHFVLSAEELEWNFDNGGSESIRKDRIIAILNQPSGDKNHHSLYVLGVESAEDSEQTTRSPLQTFQCSNLPEPLITQYLVSRPPPHFLLPPARDGSPNVHFVISTLSGTGRANNFFTNIMKPLITAIHISAYQIHETQSEETIAELTRSIFLPRASKGIKQTIILLSGDGGPVDMVNVLLSEPSHNHAALPFLGLVPLGTGNALAHSSGITTDATLGLATLLRGSPRVLPSFRVTISPSASYIIDEGRGRRPIEASSNSLGTRLELYGVVVCSWGLHASLVADSDTTEYRKYGVERFKMAAGELLNPSDGSESHHYRGRISLMQGEATEEEVQGVPLERIEHMYVLATMVSNLEEQFTISPSSRPLDGQLRLVHFGVMPPDEIMRILELAYQGGQHVHEESVGYEEVEGVKIDFEEEDERRRRICVDGKIIAVGKGGWVEVRKESREVLKLIVNLE